MSSDEEPKKLVAPSCPTVSGTSKLGGPGLHLLSLQCLICVSDQTSFPLGNGAFLDVFWGVLSLSFCWREGTLTGDQARLTMYCAQHTTWHMVGAH